MIVNFSIVFFVYILTYAYYAILQTLPHMGISFLGWQNFRIALRSLFTWFRLPHCMSAFCWFYSDSCVGLYKLINLEGPPSKCVYISPDTDILDWSSAKASCENDGAGLVTFPSAVQSQLFGDHLFSQCMSQNTNIWAKVFRKHNIHRNNNFNNVALKFRV